MTSSDRWRRLQDLFEAASRLAPEARARFLDDACGDDATLRDEVESLIRAGERVGEALEGAVAGAARAWEEGASHEGRRIGAYELTRELGRGGMGSVYLAVRADDEYRKEVAVKLIRVGADDPEIRRRFLVERQILANLDHPNVARLLDGGTTEEGLPYVVMERVEGEPIDVYCDRRRLSIEARLRLFHRVCDAVQFAHRNLVVHRDIKPGNILVTDEGVPKLLDFGIAKLLDAPTGTTTTGAAVRLMTPEYASPEQVRGEPITTASDVYSLGVLLYELLTGHRPYRLARRTPQEAERVVTAQEPERPSEAVLRVEAAAGGVGSVEATPEAVSAARGTTPERLRRRLGGDLDMIVLMALRKEPARRYASVEQLLEDVRRHLEGLPVVARPDTLGYRAGKFVGRHRVGVFGTAATVSLVAALTAFYTIRLAAERDRAQLEAGKAQEATGFLVEVFRSSDPTETRGLTLTAAEVLARGRERVESELADQPEVLAMVLDAIGRVYQSLGAYDTAAVLVARALEIRRRVLGVEHADYATSLAHLGEIEFDRNDLERADRLGREALARRRALFADNDPSVATSLANLASTLQSKGDLESAEPLYREALAIRRRLLGEEHRHTATSINNLGSLMDDKGDYAAADTLYREALHIRKKILPPNDYDLAVSLNNVARISELLGDLRGADSLYRQSLTVRRVLFGDEHPAVLRVINNLGGLYVRLGDYEAAERSFREVIAARRRRPGESLDLAVPLNNLGAALFRQGKHRGAIAALRESMQLLTGQLGNDHPNLAFVLTSLGTAYRGVGDRAAASQSYLRAIDLRRRHLPAGHPLLRTTLSGLAALRVEEGNPRAAEPLYREALEITRASAPDDSLAIAEGESDVGGVLIELGRLDEAEALLLAGYPVLQAGAGAEDPRTVRTLERLVRLYEEGGRPEAAARYRELLR